MKQVEQTNMSQLQKWGGVAALYEALAYIIGMVGFLTVVNISEIADPVQQVAAMVEHQSFLALLHLIVYVAWGVMLVVLTLALHERLRGDASAVARTATAFGIIWSAIVIASGMVHNVGMDTVTSLYAGDPNQSATVWLAVEAVYMGLGGSIEVVGGIWVLLLSVAALRNGGLPRLFNYFGFVVGGAGLLTLVPALGEAGAMVFGLTQIVWFIWLGIALLRRPSGVVEEALTPAY